MSAVAAIVGNLTVGGGGAGLHVSITAGTTAIGTTGSHAFPANTCTATGGTGPYAYLWTETDDGFGNWTITGSTTSTGTPHVGGVFPANTSIASVVCTVTDSSIPALVQTSNVANYEFFHYSNA